MNKENNYTCGTCFNYDSDNCYCPLHGEKYEEDSCKNDWIEDDGPTKEERKEMAGDIEAHRIMVEGEEIE